MALDAHGPARGQSPARLGDAMMMSHVVYSFCVVGASHLGDTNLWVA
jgi:hypothetical protein